MIVAAPTGEVLYTTPLATTKAEAFSDGVVLIASVDNDNVLRLYGVFPSDLVRHFLILYFGTFAFIDCCNHFLDRKIEI